MPRWEAVELRYELNGASGAMFGGTALNTLTGQREQVAVWAPMGDEVYVDYDEVEMIDYQVEQEEYIRARAVGFDVNLPYFERCEFGIVYEWIDGPTLQGYLAGLGREFAYDGDEVCCDECAANAAGIEWDELPGWMIEAIADMHDFDCEIGQSDRHGANVLVDEGGEKLWLVDNTEYAHNFHELYMPRFGHRCD